MFKAKEDVRLVSENLSEVPAALLRIPVLGPVCQAGEAQREVTQAIGGLTFGDGEHATWKTQARA